MLGKKHARKKTCSGKSMLSKKSMLGKKTRKIFFSRELFIFKYFPVHILLTFCSSRCCAQRACVYWFFPSVFRFFFRFRVFSSLFRVFFRFFFRFFAFESSFSGSSLPVLLFPFFFFSYSSSCFYVSARFRFLTG